MNEMKNWKEDFDKKFIVGTDYGDRIDDRLSVEELIAFIESVEREAREGERKNWVLKYENSIGNTRKLLDENTKQALENLRGEIGKIGVYRIRAKSDWRLGQEERGAKELKNDIISLLTEKIKEYGDLTKDRETR